MCRHVCLQSMDKQQCSHIPNHWQRHRIESDQDRALAKRGAITVGQARMRNLKTRCVMCRTSCGFTHVSQPASLPATPGAGCA